MKRKASAKPTRTRTVAEFTRDERKSFNKALSQYGSLQEMATATGLKRDTITRVKLSGKGLTETIDKIRGYLATKAGGANVQAGVAA